MSTVVQYLTFAGNVCARTSTVLSWSDGNVIAFCTDEGVHIMEPCVHVFSVDSSFPIAIHRHFIAAPSQPNSLEFGVDRKELLSTAPRSEVFDLMLDRTLSPAVSCQQSYKGFRQATWSPLGLGPKESCILAALTMDHRLTLYACEADAWVDIAELSLLYHNYLQSVDFRMEWMTNDALASTAGYENESLRQLKTKAYATAATQVTWSRTIWTYQSDVDEEVSLCAILAVGMKNGTIVLWKIQRCIATALFPIGNSMSIGAVFDSGVGLVRTLCWIDLDDNLSGLLIVGGSLGKIEAFVVSRDSEDALSVLEAFTLWPENDRLEISKISYSKVSEDLYNVIAGKGYFIVAWQITGRAVLSQLYVKGNFMQPIIGLFPESDNTFIGASADGVALKITFINTPDSGFTLNLENVLGELEKEHTNYFGMCPSKSRYMSCLAEGITVWHDHLLLREPYKLLLAISGDIEMQLESTLNEMDHPEARLHSIGDALHAIHYHLLKNKELPDSLRSLLNEVDEGLALQLSCGKLQLIRWLLRLLIFVEPEEDKEREFKPKLQDVEALLMERQLLLVLRAAIDQLDTLENVTVQTLGSSVSVACQWLRSRPSDHFNEGQKKLLSIVSNNLSLSTTVPNKVEICENCRLCQKSIFFENLHVGKCTSGHSFGRCCLTLSICDQPFYRKCRNCSVLANCDLFDLLKEIRCPFCGLIL